MFESKVRPSASFPTNAAGQFNLFKRVYLIVLMPAHDFHFNFWQLVYYSGFTLIRTIQERREFLNKRAALTFEPSKCSIFDFNF